MRNKREDGWELGPSRGAGTIPWGLLAHQVVLWSGHAFAFDALLATREVAQHWRGAVLGFDLSYTVNRENCELLQEPISGRI